MAEQLPETATDDPIVISDLADKVLRAANKAGIATSEISEEVPSVFEVIAEAFDHREGGTP
ncbi:MULTISPECIES: DUF768 domain-containing protein [unclassified Mesorhizobium]|uniref:DUF768 domain-containing protein n=1 Tax=unclassified Mesorhizobium TaxID=325217 RepID=UPI000FCC57BE|nr:MULTISPECIES: DUF768 domain-containing protein [unclassified Mesorhizobium]RUX84918.1 DUF768 domain-containing protein [Mesorhizobium sp. M7D.F.Ca.US.004.01.2.1]RVA25093.1 DUF768 domain-containing protein [Mesorhizobium sp. M7D.F.Ca.US.004.03.1.1]